VARSLDLLYERLKLHLRSNADHFQIFRYLTRWRLQLGAQMLKSTSSGVAQIAGEVGYESEPVFNRAFKREFGLPPARFRQPREISPQQARPPRVDEESPHCEAMSDACYSCREEFAKFVAKNCCLPTASLQI
jgi:AraC-like DNA-binding protein